MGQYGLYTWEHVQTFEVYQKGTYLRNPQRWQKYVREISNRFGISIDAAKLPGESSRRRARTRPVGGAIQ